MPNAKQTAINTLLSAPGVREYCEEQGFRVEALSIVRFHDSHDRLPWFYRQVETIAYIGEICEGGKPVYEQDLLNWVRDTYGKDVSVLYV
jgi:diketogulonate reductase-like aldo/keto reductase